MCNIKKVIAPATGLPVTTTQITQSRAVRALLPSA